MQEMVKKCYSLKYKAFIVDAKGQMIMLVWTVGAVKWLWVSSLCGAVLIVVLLSRTLTVASFLEAFSIDGSSFSGSVARSCFLEVTVAGACFFSFSSEFVSMQDACSKYIFAQVTYAGFWSVLIL